MPSKKSSKTTKKSASPIQNAEPSADVFYNSPEFADVIFQVAGDAKFYAHKVMLAARSTYLRGLFRSTMKESKETIVEDGRTLQLVKFERIPAAFMALYLKDVYYLDTDIDERDDILEIFDTLHNLDDPYWNRQLWSIVCRGLATDKFALLEMADRYAMETKFKFDSTLDLARLAGKLDRKYFRLLWKGIGNDLKWVALLVWSHLNPKEDIAEFVKDVPRYTFTDDQQADLASYIDDPQLALFFAGQFKAKLAAAAKPGTSVACNRILLPRAEHLEDIILGNDPPKRMPCEWASKPTSKPCGNTPTTKTSNDKHYCKHHYNKAIKPDSESDEVEEDEDD